MIIHFWVNYPFKLKQQNGIMVNSHLLLKLKFLLFYYYYYFCFKVLFYILCNYRRLSFLFYIYI